MCRHRPHQAFDSDRRPTDTEAWGWSPTRTSSAMACPAIYSDLLLRGAPDQVLAYFEMSSVNSETIALERVGRISANVSR